MYLMMISKIKAVNGAIRRARYKDGDDITSSNIFDMSAWRKCRRKEAVTMDQARHPPSDIAMAGGLSHRCWVGV